MSGLLVVKALFTNAINSVRLACSALLSVSAIITSVPAATKTPKLTTSATFVFVHGIKFNYLITRKEFLVC